MLAEARAVVVAPAQGSGHGPGQAIAGRHSQEAVHQVVGQQVLAGTTRHVYDEHGRLRCGARRLIAVYCWGARRPLTGCGRACGWCRETVVGWSNTKTAAETTAVAVHRELASFKYDDPGLTHTLRHAAPPLM